MKKSEIEIVIIKILKEYFETQEIKMEVTSETSLFGKDSDLDSMGLVNFIVDIESHFLDNDIEITLMSEKAMSRTKSPFRTVSTLAEFISEQIS